MDAQAPKASTILVRRMKQGMAEFFRYNLKTQMREGLKQYATARFNAGPCSYGYAEDRTPHPNPVKASMGATRARLILRNPSTPGGWSSAAPGTPTTAAAPGERKPRPCPASTGPGPPTGTSTRTYEPGGCRYSV